MKKWIILGVSILGMLPSIAFTTVSKEKLINLSST